MFERLATNGREFEEKTREHVNQYADAGLRTLILAYRELDEEEYNQFNKEFTEAKNIVSADREQIVEEVAEKIEKDLILLGATAVEDKLQNGVCFKYYFSFLSWSLNQKKCTANPHEKDVMSLSMCVCSTYYNDVLWSYN